MLTEQRIQEYIKDPSYCPYCDSDNISSDIFENEGVVVRCEDCGKKWIEVFKLVGVEEVDD